LGRSLALPALIRFVQSGCLSRYRALFGRQDRWDAFYRRVSWQRGV